MSFQRQSAGVGDVDPQPKVMVDTAPRVVLTVIGLRKRFSGSYVAVTTPFVMRCTRACFGGLRPKWDRTTMYYCRFKSCTLVDVTS